MLLGIFILSVNFRINFSGVLTGITCGLTLGVIPTIEGFMAGLMGGMMGAMLGAMVTQEQSFLIMNLFLTLSVCTLLLFPILSTPSKKELQRLNKKWLLKPLLIFLLLTTYLILGTNINKLANYKELSSTKQKVEFTLNVKGSHFSFTPSKIILKKGQEVELSLKNADRIDHDIEIKNFPFQAINSKSHGEHTNKNVDFHLHAPAKTETKLIFTPLKSGSYEFYCSIPGHKEKGMVGLLIIS